jgi:dynein heavy chain 2, cytosolic
VLIQKLYQTCQKATAATGKILRPQNCARQIFVLKEVNLAQPDKYNTIELVTFLQSLISHEGFYDHNLEFIRIGEGIQFVCIVKPSTTIGRFDITTRFVSNLRVLAIDYDSVGVRQKLEVLTPHAQLLDQQLGHFWLCLQENFKADDNAHYLFCPRNLNSMVDALEHYDIDMTNQQVLMQALRNEAAKQFEDRLVDAQAKAQFQKLMAPIFGKNGEVVFTAEGGKLKAVGREEYRQILAKAVKSYES